MSALGHKQTTDLTARSRECPLCPESGQTLPRLPDKLIQLQAEFPNDRSGIICRLLDHLMEFPWSGGDGDHRASIRARAMIRVRILRPSVGLACLRTRSWFILLFQFTQLAN